jgi:HlyD family secretion protein
MNDESPPVPSDAPPRAASTALTTIAATAKPPSRTSTTDASALLDEPAQRPWWQSWKVWLPVALVLALAGGYYWYHERQLAAAAPRYSTEAAVRGNLTLTVTANGTLQPTRSITIGSELSGTVLKVNVDVNDVVKKGQVLLVLDTAKLRDQIVRSQSAVASAGGKLAQTAATMAEARASLSRFEEVAQLSGGKVPSKAELDTARAVVARSVADHTSAQAGVQDAKATLSTDQINLSKASIVSPSDGIVLTRTVDPGNAVAASLQAVTLFTIAEDLHKLRLWVYVDEADVSSVKDGQQATFTVSAFLSRHFPAVVTRVGFGSTITENVVTYLTYLDVGNADLSLRPGMIGTASITATQRNNVLLVPNTALRFSPVAADASASDPGKKGIASSLIPSMPSGSTRKSAAARASTALAKQVYVLSKDGKNTPVAVAVKPGITDGHMTEITGGDLQAGMLVITNQKTGPAK